MKTKKLLAFAALATLTLAGCSDNDEVPAGGTSTFPADGVIRIVTNVGNPETRAGITTDNLTFFNLKIENKIDPSYSYYAAILGNNTNGWTSYVSNGGNTLLTMLWKNSTTPVTVTALSQQGDSPSEKKFNSEGEYSVLEDQTSEGIQQSDVLYMKPTEVDPAKDLVGDKLKVSFVHLFSKINLTVTLGTEFNTTPGTITNPITGMTVNGAKKTVGFNASTGQFATTNSYQSKAITPWYDASTCYTAGSGDSQSAVAKYEVILPPQTVQSGNFSITFTIGGKDYEWKSAANVVLESGRQYTLALTAGKDIVTMKSITTSEWGAGTGGKLETE